MTQEAMVTKILPSGRAEVLVLRASACGGNCESCGACGVKERVYAVAENKAAAKVGDKVTVSSSSSAVLSAAMLVYIVPIILFFFGYIDAHLLGLGEVGQILMSFAAMAAGVALVVTLNKKKVIRPVSFEIIEISGKSAG